MNGLGHGLLGELPAGHNPRGQEQRPEEYYAPFIDCGQAGPKILQSVIIRNALELDAPSFQDYLGISFL